MNAAASIRVSWVARTNPLDACAMRVRGDAVRALCETLLRREAAALAGLRGVGGGGQMVLLSDGAALPWMDDAEWLGRDLEAPSLLLPTAIVPDVPVGLFEGAVLRRAAGAETPLVVCPSVIVSVAAARPLARAKLLALVGGRAT